MKKYTKKSGGKAPKPSSKPGKQSARSMNEKNKPGMRGGNSPLEKGYIPGGKA